MDFFFFTIFPYVAVITFVLGSIIRIDKDPYSYKSKSSQFLRRKQLIIGSVAFHIGILTIFAGHFVGFFTPLALLKAIGVSHSAKQILAIAVGGVAGLLTFFGLVVLLHRRLFDKRIRVTSSVADILILVLLLAQVSLGLLSIFESLKHLDGEEMVKFMLWAQTLATFGGDASAYIENTAFIFKLHIVLGLLIVFVFPFTRLVHIASAPVFFVLRPYQVVRKK